MLGAPQDLSLGSVDGQVLYGESNSGAVVDCQAFLDHHTILIIEEEAHKAALPAALGCSIDTAPNVPVPDINRKIFNQTHFKHKFKINYK